MTPEEESTAAPDSQSVTRTILPPGTRLGPYEIINPLGAGGMGEVFKARDSRLGRFVAVKIVRQQFNERFEREARAISSLNHPHICTLYDVGPNYLVMEFVEGETLAARLRHGPLPLAETLRYAAEIAQALEAAHAQGIIHRDLKPGNIMTTKAGVKVLDFGLAKIAAYADAPLKQGETLTASRAVMGTLPYMSPEQMAGEEVDDRTDLFSFGAVFYEMVTGQRAFPKHLDRTPPPAAKVQPEVQQIIRRLLEMDRERRYTTAGEVLTDLERVQRPAPSRLWMIASAGALLLAGLAAALWWRNAAKPPDRSEWVQITNLPDSVTQPALSPDGHMLAFLRGPSTFMGRSELYVKMLPDGEPAQLTNDGTKKMSPVFSPDGSRIAYTVLGDGLAWDTWVIPAIGGKPQLWLPNAEGLAWIGKQRLLYSEIKKGIHMAVATSLDSRFEHRDVYVPAKEQGMAHRSYLSPDGRWVLIVEMDESSAWLPCRLTPFDGNSDGHPVGPPGCTVAAWSPDGQWMYLSAKSGDSYHLWRQRFPDGKPEQLTSGPSEEEGLAVAPDGHSLITAVGVRQRPIWLHDAAGERSISLEGYAFFPRFYDSGKKVAYRASNRYLGVATPSELWTADLTSGRNEPMLSGFQVVSHDVSQDGRLLFSALDAGGKPRLWLAPLDRRTPPHQIGSVEADRGILGPKGAIFFLGSEGANKYMFSVGEDGLQPRKVTAEPVINMHSVSPDGRWISGEGPARNGDAAQFGFAYPTDGGSSVGLCGSPCRVSWAPDGKYIYLELPSGTATGGAVGRTYVLPTRPGTMFPAMPAGGFRSETEIAAVRGVRVLEASADLDPGPTTDVYVYSRESVQRNLYRIPLP